MTLNQIVSRLKSLALSHKQINSAYFGDPWEFDANGEIIYGACFIEQLPGSIDRVERLQRFNFRVYFLDLVGPGEKNETDALSDMHSVCADFLAMLMSPNYQEDWMIIEQTPVSPLTETLGDMASGVFLDVGILVEFLADSCQVPADDVEFEESFDMARTRILTYTGTGSEGSSFTVANLPGKNVLAAYRGGSYKRIITTTPTDSDKIKVTGTDLGDRKGILSSDGTVALGSGDALVENEVLDFIIYE